MNIFDNSVGNGNDLRPDERFSIIADLTSVYKLRLYCRKYYL